MEPERCSECGFDGTRLTVEDAVMALRSFGPRWQQLFEGVPVDVLRRRPSLDVWSALEYAAHTRDSFVLLGFGMEEILKGEHPAFPDVKPDPVGSDGRAADHGYNELDPTRVLDELEASAARIAARAEGEPLEHWSRSATMGDQEAESGWVLRHAVHEGEHHLRDVEWIRPEQAP